MTILKTSGWQDYELLDSGEGYRLERFGEYVIAKPDPQAIWQRSLPEKDWGKADAVFEKGASRKEGWIYRRKMPEQWKISYHDLTFIARLTPFKHTGVFPEQTIQWEWLRERIKSYEERNMNKGKQLRILNLFAYTGGATLVCAKEGSQVTHVDASRPAIGWARENQTVSRLMDKPIRWILDDVLKFCQRELRRGVTYDGIIMDPPVFGHGPHGETWEFSDSFPILLDLCRQLLSEKPLFMLINAYAISASALMLQNVLQDITADKGGLIESGELALQESSGRLLSTGIFGRWSATE